MGQRRRHQRTETLSLRQVQQTLTSTRISQSSGTVVSAGGDQHALKSGPARPDHSAEGTRREGSLRAPESGSSRQARLQAAPACNEGDSPGHRSALTLQQAVHSWPRRTRAVQQPSQSGYPQEETPVSATTGQTASSSRDAQHNFTGERNEQPHTASQEIRAGPSLRNPPSEAPAAGTRSLVLGTHPIPRQQNPSSAVDEPSSPSSFQILVEAQFLIAPKAEEHYRPTVEAFVGLLAENHNRLVGSTHPAMVKKMQRSRVPSGKAEDWHVYMGSVQPPTISVPQKITLTSPLFHNSDPALWQEHVAMTWTYLTKYYQIREDAQCYNKVYINFDRSSWEFGDVKKIAQAITHFEPALDLLLHNGMSRSNSWLNNLPDTCFMEEANRTRSQAIAAIQDAGRPWQMLRPLQGRGHVYCFICYYNSWSVVWKMVMEPIHFCKPEATSVAAEAASWAYFAKLFIQAALACRSPQELQNIPPNHEGLQHFMSGKRPPLGSTLLGTHKSRRGQGAHPRPSTQDQ
ncbi:hypothetical protein GJ744_009634 [Endocarpon pusillum]|uniref:Uncharacterized protein n=1 Tax=Endocarpon pusillum TaxID=364733 RepID=A0A8H7AHN8_9EURO|nr:hypothetical protein GJ744_009634 [Endocarpon pusillum]